MSGWPALLLWIAFCAIMEGLGERGFSIRRKRRSDNDQSGSS